jgi:hypothetical protein
MSDQLQLRGGPTAQSENFVGAEREITVDTGLKRLRIHDGSTPGGHILSGKIDLDTAVAAINQTIDDNEAADAQARTDLKTLLEQELADLAAQEEANKVALQTDIDAEVAASAAYDIIQDNRLAVLEAVSNISKKELEFITLIGNPSPAAGQVGVNSFTPSAVGMIVLPNTDVNGNSVSAGDFEENDRIALKQPHGAAAVYFIISAFTFGDHIRINVYEDKTILGAGGDLAYIENNEVSAVFEDTSVTRGLITDGLATEATARAAETTARESAVTSLTDLITALQTRADALEVDPVTKTYVDTQLNDLVNGAPDALNQLNEIIAAFEGADTNLVTSVSSQGVRITALENDPTTATALAAVQADVDQNEADIDAALAAVEVRVSAAEADIVAEATARNTADASTLTSANAYTDTTAASGDATVTNSLTALVTTESSNRASADSALSSRIDVLEADPTTATALTAAVAVVQADVNQNEADCDAAVSAEEVRALAAESAITAARVAEETARNQLNLHAGLAFGQLYVGDLIVA